MQKLLILALVIFLVGCSVQPKSVPAASIPTQPPQKSAVIPTVGETMKQVKFLNIAHRGARSLAPENTILAAKKGFEIGADLWELDVAMTKDGELVVIHDDTLERTSNAAEVFSTRRPWNVVDFSFADLQTLDFGSWYNKTDPFGQIASGAVSTQDQQSFVGIKIPTLKEALKFTQDNNWKVNVEIKDHAGTFADATIVEKVVALIGEIGFEKSVMISSFNHDYVKRVKKANPAIKTAALTNAEVADWLAIIKSTGADAYNPSVKYVKAEQVAAVRAAGKDVYVWTVNDEATMKSLIKMGVSGIFTDYPQRLKVVLESTK